MSKRILVTGGAGFLGSNLCERLLQNNNTVICLDDFSTGRASNINHLLSNKDFEIIKHDITIPLRPETYMLKIDEIYNLACPASPVHYQEDPIQTIKTSVYGSINILEIAKRFNIKILQASTSEIYGDPLEHPQKESYLGNVNTIGSRACYDEGKRCAETLFFDYKRKYNLKIKVMRIFNTYGPKMDPKDGRVITNFIMQALNNEDITIYGDGTQTRSFCYVDDLINGMIKLMSSADDFSGPVNIGNPDEITIYQMANIIIRLTESKSKIKFLEIPEDDPKRRKPDITLAKKELNWEPKIDLGEGLKNTIKYLRGYYENN